MSAISTEGEIREPDKSSSNELQQFISFRIGEDQYAIDIISVREIRAWSVTTSLPNQPAFIRGVLNLRGTIVPIFDLRCRFGRGLTEAGRTHVVIIVCVLNRVVGLLVDAVSDILSVNKQDIRAVPVTDRTISSEYLSGIISVNDSMVVMLSLERLFAEADTQTSAA